VLRFILSACVSHADRRHCGVLWYASSLRIRALYILSFRIGLPAIRFSTGLVWAGYFGDEKGGSVVEEAYAAGA